MVIIEFYLLVITIFIGIVAYIIRKELDKIIKEIENLKNKIKEQKNDNK